MQASGTELPFDDDSFDLVLTVATMHHIADARRGAPDARRDGPRLRPGGRIVIWDHNPRNPYWSSLMAPRAPGHRRRAADPEAEIVAACGHRRAVILSRQLGPVPDFTPPTAMRLAAALERAFESTPGLRRFAAHNAIVATK